MLCKLKEEDFEVLKKPLESKRQSPSSLSFALILGLFFQPLLLFLEYFVANYSVYPYKEEILNVHLWFTSILVVLSLFYSIPFVYKKSEKIQYLLSILVSLNLFTIPLFFLALFLIAMEGEGMVLTAESLLNFTWILLLIGFLILLATSIRFYILLRKGHYRKESKKDEMRSRFETTSYIPAAIISGIGIVFIIQYIARHLGNNDLNVLFVIVGSIVLFFVTLFILPEQLVILYCKFRTKSFNFNERGYLNK